MRNQLRDYFINLSNRKNHLIFGFILIACLAGFYFMNTHFTKITGGDQILDSQLFYTQHEAFKNLSNYGNDGRNYYYYIQLLDLLFPIIYTFLFAMILSTVLMKALPDNERLWKLNLIPILAGVADYTENVGIFIMLRSYPDISKTLPTITNIAGIVKFSTLTLIMLIIIIASFKILANRALDIKE